MTSENRTDVQKTRVLVLLVIATNVLGNVSLSRGMHEVGRIVSASPFDYLRAFANPWTLIGICVLVIWMLSDLALLSRADLNGYGFDVRVRQTRR